LLILYRGLEKSRSQTKPAKGRLHSLGYVAKTTRQAVDEFYPGYAQAMNKIGKSVDGHRDKKRGSTHNSGKKGFAGGEC